MKLVAYNASRATVSNFLARYLTQFPAATCDMVKIEHSRRFSTIIDPSHASVLLRRIHQRESESVQSYVERLIEVAEQASTGLDNAALQALATQLVGYFIDGLTSDQIKMKLLRLNPPTLDETVNSAIYEVNLRKLFNLRKGEICSLIGLGTNLWIYLIFALGDGKTQDIIGEVIPARNGRSMR